MTTALFPSFGGTRNIPPLPIASAIERLTRTISIEMLAHDRSELDLVAGLLEPGTPVTVPWLMSDSHNDRIAAACALRAHGLEPVPHVAARCLRDREEALKLVKRLHDEADVTRILLIGGDVPNPKGEFGSSLELLVQLRKDPCGLRSVGLAAYPEALPGSHAWAGIDVLETKLAVAEDAGLAPFIMTQFVFDARPIVAWLRAFRDRDPHTHVQIGVAGPARLRTLMHYAHLCNIGQSARYLVGSGASLSRMMRETGPDPVIRALADAGVQETLGPIGLHAFSFGGLDRTVRWFAPVRHGRFRLRHAEPGFEPAS